MYKRQSLTWAEELCRYAFIWSAFVSIGYTIREKSILTLTFFVDILPKKISKVVTILAKLVTVAFFVVVFVYSIPMVEKIYLTNQTSPAMGVPMYMVYLSIAVGSFLTIIRSIQDLVVAIDVYKRQAFKVIETYDQARVDRLCQAVASVSYTHLCFL